MAASLISTASRRSSMDLMASPISCSKMSEREGVASDVIIKVFCPDDASCNAVAAEQVVLPTPPLTPNIIIGLKSNLSPQRFILPHIMRKSHGVRVYLQILPIHLLRKGSEYAVVSLHR